MKDEAFARAFENGFVAVEAFDHVAHVRVAWVYLRETASVDAAVSRMRGEIRRFAAAAGRPERYHETITVLWMRILADVRAGGASGELADVLRAHPQLADKELPLRYYSSERLFSDEARAGWVEPDRQPLTSGA